MVRKVDCFHDAQPDRLLGRATPRWSEGEGESESESESFSETDNLSFIDFPL